MRPDKPFSIQGILGQLPPYALYMVVTTVYVIWLFKNRPPLVLTNSFSTFCLYTQHLIDFIGGFVHCERLYTGVAENHHGDLIHAFADRDVLDIGNVDYNTRVGFRFVQSDKFSSVLHLLLCFLA